MLEISPNLDRREPWLGLASYSETDARLFFGREREASELLRFVRREVLTVLFGPSGTGKTSLLNAGLFPRLRESGFLPVRIRLNHGNDGPDYLEQVRARILEVVREDPSRPIEEEELVPPRTDADRETLWEYLHRVVFWDPRNHPVTLVLVFDQFEEMFTLGHRRAATGEFLVALADLVENYIPTVVRSRIDARGEALPFPHDRPSCKVVLSLREDFVWRLDGLRKSMPSVMHNRFTVSRMNGEQAVQAVREPGRGMVESSVAEEIVRFVAAANQSRAASDEDAPLDGLLVDPALLSVVCRELNTRRIGEGKSLITTDLLEQAGTNILNDFYEHGFAGVSAAARAFVEDRLLTASGFRSTVPQEEATQAGIEAAEVETLVDRRLLRVEERLGIPHLELSHDLLTRVVQRSRADRQQHEQRERERRQRQVEDQERAAQEKRREEELRRARRLLALVTAGALICLGLLIAVAVLYRIANVAKNEAVVAKVAGEKSRDAALRDRTAAETARDTATKNEAIAKEALTRADENERKNRQLLYVSRVGLAERAAEQEEYEFARDVLVSLLPAGGLTDPREFSWYYVWRATPDRPVSLPQKGVTRQVAFSRNGKVLAVRDTEGVTVWLSSSLKSRVRLDSSSVESIAVSPDGNTLAVGSRDRLQLWDISSPQPQALSALEGDLKGVRALAFSPDGALLAAGGLLRLWDLKSRAMISIEGPPIETPSFSPGAGSVAFSPDGSTLAVCADNGVTLIDVQRRRERRSLVTDEASFRRCASVAIAANGRVAAAGAGCVIVWNGETGDRIALLEAQSSNVLSVAFSPDDNLLVAAGADNLLMMWDARELREVASLTGNARTFRARLVVGNVYSAAFSPDGKTLATASAPAGASLWDVKRWAERYPLTAPSPSVASLAFSADGRRLVTGDVDGTTRVWDPISRREMMATMRRGHGEAISSVAVSLDGRTIATGGGRLAKLWDAASGREIGSLQRRDPKWSLYSVQSVAFSPDGTLLAVADAWAVTLWEAATRRELDPLPGTPAHTGLVAFSPDGAFLVSTGAPLRTWSLRSKTELAAMTAGIEGSGAIAFSPDGKMLAVGATANTIRVWELATPKQLEELKGHSDYVTALAFSADGKTLASGSADESIKLWDTISWQEIVTLKESSRVTSVAFSPRTNLLASSTLQGVRLWYTDSAADVQRAMARPRPPR